MKIFIYKLLLLGCMLSAVNLSAQTCKPDKYFKDKFAGVKIPLYGGKVAYSKSILFGHAMYTSIYVYKQDGKTKFGIDIGVVENQSLNNSKHRFEKGSEMLVRTNNGVIKLRIDEVNTSMINSSSKTIRTYSLINHIDESKLRKLSKGLFQAYKVVTAEGGVIQEQIKEGKAVRLQSQFNCFLALSGLGTGVVTDANKLEKNSNDSSGVDGIKMDSDYRDRKILLNMGIGFAPTYGLDPNNILKMGVDIPIKDKVSIETFLGVNKDVVYSYLVFGGKLNYLFIQQTDFEVSGQLGFGIASGKSDFYEGESDSKLLLKGAFRYYFSDNFSAFTDAGIGVNTFSFGLSLGL